MRQSNLPILWEPGDHPPLDLLRQYQEDLLPPALQHQLERHLLDCSLCSDVLEGMALSDTDKTEVAVTSINQRITAKIKKRKRRPLPVYLTDWRVAAAILLVLCSTVLVFYYNYKEISQQEQNLATSDTGEGTQQSIIADQETGPIPTETIAEVLPDTVRSEAVASVASPAPVRHKFPSRLTPVEKEVTASEPIAPAPDEHLIKLSEAIPQAPAIAGSANTAESVKPLDYQSKAALVPETTAVTKALAGSVAGVRKRATNAVATNQVRGQVLSSSGQPLPGVAVTIKGTTAGVATDANGNFTITLPHDKATLAFSFIGFEREEKSIEAGTQNLTVNMQENKHSLSEVVVTRTMRAANTPPPVLLSAKPTIGIRAYRKYLEEGIRYTSAMEKGRVVVQATVSPAGALQNLQVVKSLCPACDAEAIRLIKEGPAWKPATIDGAGTEQQIKIMVRFKP